MTLTRADLEKIDGMAIHENGDLIRDLATTALGLMDERDRLQGYSGAASDAVHDALARICAASDLAADWRRRFGGHPLADELDALLTRGRR